jgi:hypothetical protein
MELKRDLLVIQKKSVFRISMGILFIVISIVWIVDLMIESKTDRLFDWLYFGLFFLNGIVFSIEGFGFSVSRLLGKAFIMIDNERIVLKPGVLVKEQNILWQDINSISNRPVRCQIARIDGTTVTLNLSKLDYSLVKEIKSTINEIANEKGLEVS